MGLDRGHNGEKSEQDLLGVMMVVEYWGRGCVRCSRIDGRGGSRVLTSRHEARWQRFLLEISSHEILVRPRVDREEEKIALGIRGKFC
jgi:hypothetical protein